MTFFFDRCVAIAIANIVKALEAGHDDVIYHDDRFGKATPDTEWLAAVSKWSPKPIVISGDTRILVNRDEAAELAKSDIMFVCLAPGWTNLEFRELAWKFLKAWTGIRETVGKAKQPTIFTVAVGSSLKVEPLSPTKKYRKR